MENWELYWAVIGYGASVVSIGIMGYLFYRFVKPFLPVKKHGSVIGITYILVMLLLKFYPYEIDAMAAYAIGIAAAFFAMYFMDKRNVRQKMFLAVTFYLMEWISWGIIVNPWGILYDLLIMPRAMMEHPLLQWILFIVLKLLYVVLEFLVTAFFIRLIHRVYVCKKENITKGELVLMLVPFLSMIAGEWMIRYCSGLYEKDFGAYLWDMHGEYEWLQAFYLLMSGATVLIVIMVYQRLREGQRKEKEDAVLVRQIEDMKGHINEVEKLYSDIRSLKHDMVNHMLTLEKLYQRKGDRTEAEDYAAQLKERIGEMTTGMHSGNPVTDVILREKQKEAEEKGIAFQCEFHYPEGTGVNAFDVSVILHNALGNAIEGAEGCRNPEIRIKSSRKKNAYLIEIRNSFTGTLVIDRESGLPESTKSGQEHGFGLINIRKVARKYYGDLVIEQEGDDFVLSVMLMLE